jgi:hypothetical protein
MAKRIFSLGIGYFVLFSGLLYKGIMPAEAQTAGPIVLSCPFADGSETLTIDLGNNFVTDHYVKANPGGFPDPLVEDWQGQIVRTTDETISWHITKKPAP